MAPGVCPGCGSRSCTTFYEARRAPTSSHRLCSSRSEAVALPRGDIELAFCSTCGFVFNAAFDPSQAAYSDFHDEGRGFATFKAFEHRLADQLVSRYELRGKQILEIGCGMGEFLTLLCELGGNLGVGFDPGYLPEPEELPSKAVAFRKELFTEHSVTEPTDLVCGQMLLECIPDTARFVDALRRVVSRREQARLFLQVPDLVQTLKHFAFWEIHYEHCSYFSPGTLQRLLSAHGFAVNDMWTGLHDQLVMADARAGGQGSAGIHAGALLEPVAELEKQVARFALECPEKQALWCDILRGIASAGNRTMVWGSGPRTVSFLTTLAVGDEVGWVVDPDPRRQGKYLPGTGHPIVAPAAIAALRPDVIIIMNAIYAIEIRDMLANVGCDPTLLIA